MGHNQPRLRPLEKPPKFVARFEYDLPGRRWDSYVSSRSSSDLQRFLSIRQLAEISVDDEAQKWRLRDLISNHGVDPPDPLESPVPGWSPL
jgi:hypothetical protein